MDKKHFSSFYESNIKRVYRFLLYRVQGNREVAEDLTHDVFIKAFDAFERYDPEISEASWIYTIARNHLINYIEKTRPGVELETIEQTEWGRIDWDERMSLRHDEERLWNAIGKLPSEDAEIVRLKYLEGWSYEDIAERLGKTAGALRVQSLRALRALKGILKQK